MERVFESASGNFTTVFRQAVLEVMTNGTEVRPRGMLTKEISPATLIVDPHCTLYPSPLRNLNWAFLLAENLWYLSGRADTHFLSYYNSNIKNFSADGLHDGAYGPKIVAQLRYVIETLQKDPDSRQAILSLWERNPRPSKDVPCTSLFQFMIRDGKLNLYVTMRSNDIIFGSHYDVPSFALIQLVVASCLGIPAGTLFHTANSLHLYEQHFELANNLMHEQLPIFMKVLELMAPQPMCLEEHVRQLDLLSSFESCLRNFKVLTPNFSRMEEIDPFYQQYVYVFALYKSLKTKDTAMRDMCVEELQKLKSPFGKLYAHKYGLPLAINTETGLC
jgi:thymidylate synthase